MLIMFTWRYTKYTLLSCTLIYLFLYLGGNTVVIKYEYEWMNFRGKHSVECEARLSVRYRREKKSSLCIFRELQTCVSVLRNDEKWKTQDSNDNRGKGRSTIGKVRPQAISPEKFWFIQRASCKLHSANTLKCINLLLH